MSLTACIALATGVASLAAPTLPARLADTGLHSNGDVLEFSPQYPLWSDGATKRRWIWLPPGTSIDAANPDAWVFPRGTKLWKEFRVGRAVETRYIELGADGAWRFGSYVWNEAGTEATLAPSDGIRELPVGAGRYTIPAVDDCRACHEAAPAPVLGFSALQLSPDRDPLAPHAEVARGDGADLGALVRRGWLRNLPARLLASPPRIAASGPAERAALGYLHGNCGHCHNDDGPLAVLDLTLAQRVGVAETGAVPRSVVGVRSDFHASGVPADAARVAPGHPSMSVVALRMASRDPLQQMPPLGTAAVDTQAVALIARWIEGLSPRN